MNSIGAISKEKLLEKINNDPDAFADQFMQLYHLVNKRILASEDMATKLESLQSEMDEKDKLLMEARGILKYYHALTVH